MIRIKNKQEIVVLKRGGRILASLLDDFKSIVKPGVNTAELEAIAQERIASSGGRPAFKSYPMPDGRLFPSALCTSINNEVVHGPALPGRILKEGDVLKIDVGMEYPLPEFRAPKDPVNPHSELGGFYTDTARTYIVGQAPAAVVKFVQTAEECLRQGIKAVKPGNDLNDIGRAIQAWAESRGYSVVREMVGHGVGHELHEDPQVPHYEIKDNSLDICVLRPGMVIAIEPMLNMGAWPIKAGPDGFAYVTRDGSLSAQFEHSLFVTETGAEIITV